MRRHVFLSIGLAGALALTGCGDSGSGSATDGGLVRAALSEVPASVLSEDDGSSASVFIADLRTVAELNGAPAPSNAADQEGHVDWVRAVEDTGESPSIVVAPLPQFLRTLSFDFEALEGEIGFNAADVDWFVETFGPPAQFTVFSGVDAKDGLVELEDGIRTIGEGEDLAIDLEAANNLQLDRLGRPVRVGGRDGLTALSFSTPDLAAWLALDAADSLAAVPAYAEVAAVLDEAGVVSAMISALGVSASEATADLGGGLQPDDLQDRILGEAELAEPFSLVGIGWRADGMVAIAYVFEDDSEAAGNRDAIATVFERASTTTGEPFRDFLEVETVQASGSAVVVTASVAESRRPRVVIDLAFRQEPIFWHE